MKRGIQIIVSLLAVVLLVRPFDCFADAPTPETMRCCLKGKCAPVAKADDCCKNTVPEANNFLGSKATVHWTPEFALTTAPVSTASPAFAVQGSLDLLRQPQPSPGPAGRNLPLLI